MLKQLTFTNFRGFKQHLMSFRPLSVAVGRNNAGKSTIVEALRLVSVIVNRLPNLNFRSTPAWLTVPAASSGVTPSLRGIDFHFENVCFHYDDPPAVIAAELDNAVIEIYITSAEKEVFAVIRNERRSAISTKDQARNLQLSPVHAMPPIGPVAVTEKQLTTDYIMSSLATNFAPQHFRNQLYFLNDKFNAFVEMAEATWPGLRIHSLNNDDGNLALLVRDGTFVAELAWMGHGLQGWLQTIWFLARLPGNSTVILDEPDIYLHADLQRKLIRLLKDRYPQVIIATHSIEIMSEVGPESVLIIDKSKDISRFAPSLPAVQKIIDHIGGIHNLQLARLWTARRCLLIEGEDLTFLKVFQDKLFPDSQMPFDMIPNIPIEGFGGWKIALGVAVGLKNAGNEQIETYCILDSDYRTEEQLLELRTEAKRHKLHLHIWAKKEIESYLVVPAAIHRLICQRVEQAGIDKRPSLSAVEKEVERICNRQKNDTQDAIANEIFIQNRAGGITKANFRTRARIKEAWKTRSGKINVVSGKKILSGLSRWSKRNYGVSFSRHALVSYLRKEEIDPEVVKVVAAIESNARFV